MNRADTMFEYDLDDDHGALVGLLRFDRIDDVIPADAVITSATVTFDVADSGDRPASSAEVWCVAEVGCSAEVGRVDQVRSWAEFGQSD
jgi:hypothetical protein